MEVTPEDLEISAAIKPRAFLLVRTAWFFGAFVASGAARRALVGLSRARALLGAQWARAANRARGITSG